MPMSASAVSIHPTATVDEGAQIGAGTKIWHYCHVMSGARVGEGCVLGQNVFVGGRAVIGARVKIQNNVSVYDGVVLEDEVFCGPSMVFTNVTNPRAFVERKDQLVNTLVQRGATLGANCTVVCGCTIGPYALIGAGAVVSRDVAAHALVLGCPARQAGWVCRCGETLSAVDGALCCSGCKNRYALRDGGLQAGQPEAKGLIDNGD